MVLVEFPFGLPGRIFRSPMPFSGFDPGHRLFSQYQQVGIAAVVLLVEDGQCLEKSGRDLRQLYRRSGMHVIQLPIRDYGVPSSDSLEAAIQEALQQAHLGKNLVVHCYAGLGRTGMFLACLAQRALGMPAEESIRWVRAHLPDAIETEGQLQVIRSFQEGKSE